MKNNTLFKTLTYLDNYVDTNLLEKGIYTATKPTIYDNNTTLEMLIEQAQQVKDMLGNTMIISDSYINNLKQCQLKNIEITFI
jgi:hypothetical protein